jgi:SAM-dependent methyltransferase
MPVHAPDEDTLNAAGGLRLNLGCGSDIRPGYINVDRVPHSGVDLVHDLDVVPYPWTENSVCEVLMRHSLEHVHDVTAVMNELWRILVPGGIVRIIVPHFTSCQALTHPEHRHAFSYNTLRAYTREAEEPYTDRYWKVLESDLWFPSRLLTRLFNRHKGFYTNTCLAYLLPASEVRFLLTPVKEMP